MLESAWSDNESVSCRTDDRPISSPDYFSVPRGNWFLNQSHDQPKIAQFELPLFSTKTEKQFCACDSVNEINDFSFRTLNSRFTKAGNEFYAYPTFIRQGTASNLLAVTQDFQQASNLTNSFPSNQIYL